MFKSMEQLTWFVIVGAIGFCVDAGLLIFLSENIFDNLYLSRILSFLAAVYCTWRLNRRFTFSKIVSSSSAETKYERYIVVQILAALINLLVFYLLIRFDSLFEEIPVAALAVGSVFGLVVNFIGSKKWVFIVGETKIG